MDMQRSEDFGKVKLGNSTLLSNSKKSSITFHIYALYRQAHMMEEPARSKTVKKIKQVMQFRNLTVPRMARPLVLQFLAHDSFKDDTR